ncbi:MAG TPA: tetratricopeptide repeat protein [Trueperaceae bacterium]
MRLRTLGRLALDDSKFRRVKPLLLLAYLALEGPKPRRYLAEVFWPGASDAMNSLSVALSQLRRGVPGSIEADEARAWTEFSSDATELQSSFAEGELERVAELYCGPFLEGLELELGVELEEWFYGTREALAATAREALLRLAEAAAAQGDFDRAGQLAERAYRLPGAPEPEPESLVRFYALLAAGGSAALPELKREAEAFDISLRLSAQEARARLRQLLLGRGDELARLAGMAEGEWAWLRGPAAMGKTSLLKELPGTYLPARAGLPYATLEPLLDGKFGESETEMLRRLSTAEGRWLLDDWEQMDMESRMLLTRLRSLRPRVRVVIAAKEAPPFPVDTVLDLGPLPPEALADHPGAWEQTGGLPELLGAYLREEPLEAALERRLDSLAEDARSVYLSLALAGGADPALARRALGLSGAATGNALDELLAAGLIEPSGRVRARQSALDYLETRPTLMGPLALRLARTLRGAEAFPLYQKARALWDEDDLRAVTQAYATWGEELLRRGFAKRAVEALAEAPESPETNLLKARALERAGQYKEALEALTGVPDNPMVSALKSALFWRLSKPEEARRAAERALEGGTEARAEAFNTLGHLARSQGNNEEAASFARRAAALWQVLGDQTRWVGALINLAIARTLLGDASGEAFRDALEAAGDHGSLKARTLLNLGWAHEREKNYEMAGEAYHRAAEFAERAGAISSAARAWNNLGVLSHKHGRLEAAEDAYEQALAFAQRAGEQLILGMVMANLAELTKNLEAWEEALRILEMSGHGAIAEAQRSNLTKDHPFRLHSEQRAP